MNLDVVVVEVLEEKGEVLMMISGGGRGDQDVINVDCDEVKAGEDVVHVSLEGRYVNQSSYKHIRRGRMEW